MINRNSDLYDAIEDAVYKIFEGDILIDDPMETTKDFIKSCNNYLSNIEDDEE